MKLWKDLPTEILENIFTFINDSDQIYTTRKQNLFQCELVCRQWKPAAKRLAYSDITLTSEESTQTLIAMAREDQGQSFGELVRCIHFKLTPSPQYYAVYVPNLMTLFPLVEHITAQDPTKQLYQVLDTASKNWTRLQTISRPIDLESLPYYGSFALKYCQSLTTVFIGDNTVSSLYESITPDTQSWNRVLQNLNQFPNLEQLDIQNLSESGLDSFDSVIEQCPTTLQSLGFRILRESLARADTAPI